MKKEEELKELSQTTMIILKGLKDAMTYMETITLVFADAKITIEPLKEDEEIEIKRAML